jgi:hypothetical protein
MAALTARRRKKLRSTQFASPKGSGPNKKKNQYPVDTKKRAISAKGRATQQYKKGKISKSTRDRIRAKANRALRRKKR